MHRRLASLTSSPTVKNSAVTVVGSFASAGLGAVFYLLVAKILGPSQFGLFTLGMSLMIAAMSVADLGSSQGLIRFASSKSEQDSYQPYAKLALLTKMLMGLFVWLILIIFSTPISIFLNQPEVRQLAPFVGLVMFAQLVFGFSLNLFQARQKFYHWTGLQIGSNAFRLVLLVPLLIFGASSDTAMLVVSLASLGGFLISWKWLDLSLWRSRLNSAVFHEFFNFNKWTTSFVVLSTLVSRLDTFLTGKYLNLDQLGVYGLATTMSSFMPQLSIALGAVTSSRFAATSNSGQARAYLKKTLFFNTAVSLVVALCMVPVAALVIWITGRDYSQSFWPFLILLAGLVVFTSTNPLRDNILYHHHKPQFFVVATFIQGAVILMVGPFFLNSYGVIGGAATSLLSQVVLLIVCSLYYKFSLKK